MRMLNTHKFNILLLFFVLMNSSCGNSIDHNATSRDLSYSPMRPQIITLDLSVEDDGSGGLIAADLNGDGRRDFIVTGPGRVVAWEQSGNPLWKRDLDIRLSSKAEDFGLPGLHAPGVQVADIDGNGGVEALLLTEDGSLHILRGDTGKSVRSIELEHPRDAERWEHLVVADFRGEGDRDILLQTTNAKGYRMGSHIAAYSLDGVGGGGEPKLLWTRSDFLANAHNGARVADLDGDGKDEVLGGTIVGPDGKILARIPLEGHIDSLFVADVRPDIPGLEVIALEEGPFNRIISDHNRIFMYINDVYMRRVSPRNRVFLYNAGGLIWETHYRRWEPQNAALGEFDPGRPGLEVWCRSRFDTHQKPFVFGARGERIARYQMDDVAPKDWTDEGVELIHTIDWTGGPGQLAAAKERHKSGDVGIFDPITGRFLHRFKEKADRLYVADVSGDWREELIVLNGSELHIYENGEENPNPDEPRLWTRNYYSRGKMTWNYYSP